MGEFEIVKVEDGTAEENLFNTVPKQLYPEGSQRFVFGNEPQTKDLMGKFILLRNGRVIGRFALYTPENLLYHGEKAACIGSFECVNDADSATYLLDFAKKTLKALDFKYLIGPMEGSTWDNYRFSKDNSQPNFFLEPYNHTYYNQLFLQNGFAEIASFISNLDDALHCDKDLLQKEEDNYHGAGAIIRNIDMQYLRKELIAIAEFCNEAFSSNFLFTPIDPLIFADKYEQLSTLFLPEHIWIFEDSQRNIQAICFNLKDYNDPKGKTLIIKSLARRKDSKFKGIGNFLANKTYYAAIDAGYDKIIHAFMIVENKSVGLSEDRNGRAYKNYSLYGIRL